MHIFTQAITLACVLAFVNSAAFANGTVTAEDRSVQILEMARNNPKEFLAKLSREELQQLRQELRTLIQGLQVDFSQAKVLDNNHLGFILRDWGGISSLSFAVLTLAFSGKYSGVKVRNGVAPSSLILMGLTGLSVAVTAGGQVLVQLTPEQAEKVKDKIQRLVQISNAVDWALAKSN